MVKFVETELQQLRGGVYDMWTLVSSQMELARQAVLGMDRNIARQVIVRERRVDAMELKLDSEVEDFIALYTPVAVDLRFVLAMFKINGDLERIGDYADGIARFVKDSDAAGLDAELAERLQLETMFSTLLIMMDDLRQSLMDEDAVRATSVMAMDDTLDAIKAASGDVLVDYARKNIDAMPLCMGLGGVFRKLERAGDHLSNIAEEIVFYIDAKVLKHPGTSEQ